MIATARRSHRAIAAALGVLTLALVAASYVRRVEITAPTPITVGDRPVASGIAYNARGAREPCRITTPANCLQWSVSDSTRLSIVETGRDTLGYSRVRLEARDPGTVWLHARRVYSDGTATRDSVQITIHPRYRPGVRLVLPAAASSDTSDAQPLLVGDTLTLPLAIVAQRPGGHYVAVGGDTLWLRIWDSTTAGRDSLRRAISGDTATPAPPDTASPPPPPAAPVLVSLHVSPSSFALAPAARRSVNVWGRIRVAPDSAIRVATEAELHALAGPFTFTSSDSTVAAAWSQGAGSLWGTVEALSAGTARVTACAAAASPAAGLCGYPGTVTVAP